MRRITHYIYRFLNTYVTVLYAARYTVILSVVLLILSGCRGNIPVEPTLAVLPTETPSPQSTGLAVTITPTIIPTVLPTKILTPTPTLVTVTPSIGLASATPNTPDAESTQSRIVAVDNGNGGKNITISEEQINGAIKREFDAAPLPNYHTAPHITLADDAVIITASIVPKNAPSSANTQTMTLVGALFIANGGLDLQPSDLSPLDVGVTTLQVKLSHRLMIKTIDKVVRTTLAVPSTVSISYQQVSVNGGSMTVTVANQ